MNMFKKNGGFTLVELIVVIAILAILAGVAVPAYSGYIERAKDAAVITKLDAIQTAVQAANATGGAVSVIELNKEGTSVKATAATGYEIADDFGANFDMFYGSTGNTASTGSLTITAVDLEGSSYANGATWYGNDAVPTGKVAGWNAN